MEIDSIGNHDYLFAPASQQVALRKQQSSDGARLTDNPLTSRLIPDSRNQSETVHPFDDRADTRLLCRADSLSPCVDNADIDAIRAQLRNQLAMIFFAPELIPRRPGVVQRALGISEQNRDAQTLDLAQQFARAKGIEVGLESAAIQTPQNLEAALLLSSQLENVTKKSDS